VGAADAQARLAPDGRIPTCVDAGVRHTDRRVDRRATRRGVSAALQTQRSSADARLPKSLSPRCSIGQRQRPTCSRSRRWSACCYQTGRERFRRRGPKARFRRMARNSPSAFSSTKR
jgi:hypothetical protein